MGCFLWWCRGRDSNSHTRNGYYALNVARLPFRHLGIVILAAHQFTSPPVRPRGARLRVRRLPGLTPRDWVVGGTGLEPVTSSV